MKTLKSAMFYFTHEVLKKFNMENILFASDNPIDLIVDNLYLGDFRAADDINLLKGNGITHIINCAYNIPSQFPEDFQYISLNLHDDKDQDISSAMNQSLEFIASEGIANKKVFVHCIQGKSRSCAIIIGYLIKIKGMKYDDALELVCTSRKIAKPNDGFEEQLRRMEAE